VTDAIPTYLPPLELLTACAFVVGACLGSFLNVVIARLPFGESLVWPPSACRACGKLIRPLNNIPVLSWFILRGRCPSCQARFSIRYAFVELLFGLVCAFAVARHGLSLESAREVLLMGCLVPLAFIDLDWWILPRSLTLSGALAGLLLAIPLGSRALIGRLFACSLGFTVLVLVGFLGERVFKREAVGGGDPWLLGMIGAFLGARALLPVLLLASIQGTLIGAVMIISRRRAKASEPSLQNAPDSVSGGAAGGAGDEQSWEPDPTAVPFGPFLALGAAEVLYFSRLPDLLFPIPL
jgi:leader peptidase (prepilin peptidase)/N-methyltransferase